jgi:hypothetical protein
VRPRDAARLPEGDRDSPLGGLLTARANSIQRLGVRVGLQQKVIGTEGPEFQLVYLSDSFADWDASRRKVVNSAAHKAQMLKIHGALSTPQTMRFFEYVVPVPRPIKAGEVLHRSIVYLADPWQEEAMIAPWAEITRKWQAAGLNVGLIREHFASPDGQTIQNVTGIKSISEIGDFWATRASVLKKEKALTASWMKVFQESNHRKTADTELWEILVAIPPK